MQATPSLDSAGRRRSPATLSAFHQGIPPRNKGLRHPPDPPTVEEIVAVMRAAGDSPEGIRLRGIIVVLWRIEAAPDEWFRPQQPPHELAPGDRIRRPEVAELARRNARAPIAAGRAGLQSDRTSSLLMLDPGQPTIRS